MYLAISQLQPQESIMVEGKLEKKQCTHDYTEQKQYDSLRKPQI